MLNALKFVCVTVSGWLAPGAWEPHGLLTPRTWPRPTRSTVPPRLAGQATWAWPRLAAASRWPHALLLCLALPSWVSPRPRCAAIAYALPMLLASRRCCCRRIVVASAPIRYTLYVAAGLVQGHHCHTHMAELAVALSFRALRPRGPRRSKTRVPFC